MEENIGALIGCKLDIPFKEFTAGQIIQSKQFNDDMKDIEDKTNQIIEKHNSLVNSHNMHVTNFENPHKTTAHQVGAYTIEEVDFYVNDLKAGNFNDNAIVNRVLADSCVETRNIKDGIITITKVDEGFGSQLDISQNTDITNRYTKVETDEIIKSKVGDGTYTKEEIDNRFNQVQAGQIVDKSIDVEQLKDNVGRLINLSSNPSIIDRYTKVEVDSLIASNGVPRDFGSITDPVDGVDFSSVGALPVADVMLCNNFISTISNVLDVDIKEVVEGRGVYQSLSARLNLIESSLDSIIQMFSEVIINE